MPGSLTFGIIATVVATVLAQTAPWWLAWIADEHPEHLSRRLSTINAESQSQYENAANGEG